MTDSNKTERLRGLKEGREQIPLLQKKWPVCFPADPKRIRPLASDVAPAIMQEFGWTQAYTKGVIHVWKTRPAYCQAILRFTERLKIDGLPSTETVDDHARKVANENLERHAAKCLKNAEAKRMAAQTPPPAVQATC